MLGIVKLADDLIQFLSGPTPGTYLGSVSTNQAHDCIVSGLRQFLDGEYRIYAIKPCVRTPYHEVYTISGILEAITNEADDEDHGIVFTIDVHKATLTLFRQDISLVGRCHYPDGTSGSSIEFYLKKEIESSQKIPHRV